MANQTVVSAAAIWQALFDTLTGNNNQMDFTQSGECYFVDGNAGLDTNDGLSWETAFVTLNRAIQASNANIAALPKGWASRNKIYVKGDRLDEDLTTFPNKCDVIGVGSCDAYIGAGIIGNHAPTNSGNYGTRFININFFPQASGTDIVILASTSSGVEFHGCTFIGVWHAYTPASAIDSTASPQLMISKCRFLGGFTGDVIDIGAGDASGTKIVDNEIVGGADNGIVITGVATIGTGSAGGAMSRGLIARNNIQVADKVIDSRATSIFNVVDNKCISGEVIGALSYVIDLTYASGNIITGADRVVSVPSSLITVKATPVTAGRTYYVHKGGDNAGGLSWAHAFTTIAAAIAAHTTYRATISSAQKSINSYIYIAPGTYAEALTSLPFSCTIIGLGIPGTDKAVLIKPAAGACITGTVSGLKLINIRFEAVGAVNLLDFDISNNVEILDCEFECGDTANLAAISNTGGGKFMTIRGNKFGSQIAVPGFSYCLKFTSWFSAALIEDNVFDGMDAVGTAISIHINSVGYGAVIRNNIIRLNGAGVGIDDNADDAMVIGNKVFHVGGTPYDINAALSMNNRANDNGTVTEVPDLAQY